MSSWSFVALSFLLLFLGALVSLFLKRKLQPQDPPITAQKNQEHAASASDLIKISNTDCD